MNTFTAMRYNAIILIAFLEIRTNMMKTHIFIKYKNEKCSGISHLPFYVYINVASIIFYKYYIYKYI